MILMFEKEKCHEYPLLEMSATYQKSIKWRDSTAGFFVILLDDPKMAPVSQWPQLVVIHACAYSIDVSAFLLRFIRRTFQLRIRCKPTVGDSPAMVLWRQ